MADKPFKANNLTIIVHRNHSPVIELSGKIDSTNVQYLDLLLHTVNRDTNIIFDMRYVTDIACDCLESIREAVREKTVILWDILPELEDSLIKGKVKFVSKSGRRRK